MILASNSPRRRDLLAAGGIPAVVVPAHEIVECHDAGLSPAELTCLNARAKAEWVARTHPEALVLGADTLVFLEGEPLGKPADHAEARAMLRRLAGRTHDVVTGVCLCAQGGAETVEFHDLTRVTFHSLDEAAIDAYLAKINPFDKAGAYAAQEHGDAVIARVEGSWTNVIGLPMEKTLAHLKRWNIP